MRSFKQIAIAVGGAIILAGATALLFDNPVHANTIMGVEGSCEGLSQQAGRAAALRDAGITYADIAPELDSSLKAAYKREGSYIQDEEDIEFVKAAFVYAFSTKSSPEVVALTVWRTCMFKGNGVHI